MRSTPSVGVSLALIAVAASVYALPISTPETNNLTTQLALSPSTIIGTGGGLSDEALMNLLHFLNGTISLRRDIPSEVLKPQLETRLSAGTIGNLEELGKGLLTGGAFAGLLGLLNGTETRDLSSEVLKARGGVASVVESLIGAGETGLGDVLKNAAIGGAASGVINNIVSSVLGARQPQAAAIVKAAENAAKDTLGGTIGNGILGGVGSAIGGSVIGEAFSHLFNRSLTSNQLTQPQLLQMAQASNVEQRTIGSVAKSIAGLVAGLGASTLAGEALDKFESVLKRELQTAWANVLARDLGLNDSELD